MANFFIRVIWFPPDETASTRNLSSEPKSPMAAQRTANVRLAEYQNKRPDYKWPIECI